ncbi:phosphopantetheine-binding protein [Serratia marcescens]
MARLTARRCQTQETLAQSIREPAPEQERLICGAMAQLLGMDRIGADDDFFALGGDSISAMGLGTACGAKGTAAAARDLALHTPRAWRRRCSRWP